MFLDVRDFTGFAERAAPQEVVSTLNRLFERAVPIVRKHGGHVDKFIGDGFLAVFGAPRRASDHADRALAAALEIARARRGAWPTTSSRSGSASTPARWWPAASAAPGGSSSASSATRSTSPPGSSPRPARPATSILLSERTRELLQGEHELVERPGIELKGKSEPVTLYAPVGGGG